VSEQLPPPLPRTRRRASDGAAPKATVQRASLVLYGVLTLGLIAVTAYTAAVLRHPLTSGYVAAPAIGALWFGLRLFMIWGSRR